MKILSNLNLSQNELQEGVLHLLAAAPSNPVVGQVYFNTKDKKAYIYTALNTWEVLGMSAAQITKLESIAENADRVIYSSMPVASKDNVGSIVIYSGETTPELVSGHTYKCVLANGAYKWEEVMPTITGKETTSAKVAVKDGEVSVDVKVSTAANNAITIKEVDGVQGLYVEATEVGSASGTEDGLMTSIDKKKLDGIAEGAQVNVIEGVQVNGVDLVVDDQKKVNILTPEATTEKAGLMSAADKTKIDGMAAGAEVNKIDTITVNGASVNVEGKNAAIVINDVSESASGLMSKEDKKKLNGVAEGATKNATDAHLLDRANHTGTQSADTIVDGTTNKVFTADEKVKLEGLENYSLPTASADTLGGIKVGAGLSIDSNGILSANEGGKADSVDWTGVLNKPSTLGTPLADEKVGTFTKITFDKNGLVTKGENLVIDDIPDLSTKYVNVDQKAVANGVATLDNNGKIDFEQLPDSVLGNVKFGGTFDPSTGVCALADGKIIGIDGKEYKSLTIAEDNAANFKGYYFLATTTGTLVGTDFITGDWCISNGTEGWKKVDNTDAVMGVKGAKEDVYRIGQVNITAANVGAVEANEAITGGTFTKVTVDAKGLVTAGAEKIQISDVEGLDGKYVAVAQGAENKNKMVVTDNEGNVTTVVHKHVEVIGDGSQKSFTITHNMNTKDVIVQVSDASTYEVVLANIVVTNENVITVNFAKAPAQGAYRVIVLA